MAKDITKPIKIPEGVTVDKEGEIIRITGPKGTLEKKIRKEINFFIDGNSIRLESKEKNRFSNSLLGLYRSLINNMIKGVTQEWHKGLELVGVGYKAAISGKELVLNVGFSHPVIFPIPEGINITLKENKINIWGIDKELVGETAAKIRRINPPEPYKGKGIRYLGEIVRKKAGKAAKTATAASGGSK